ncbi:MAG: cyclase family protein [Acidimicrobiia bacterium]|nr:cyclase family protein [Acidimicrobiia bacterium]
MDPLPHYSDLPRVAGLPSSWGLWGDAGTDRLGCLNLLTPERVVDAATLVRRGAVFPLNWSMGLPDPPLFGRDRLVHEVTGGDESIGHDDILDRWNTQSSSQWDGFRHIRNTAARTESPGTGHYGGVPDREHGIDHWARRGIVGRAVLCDIGRFRESQGRALRHDTPDVIGPDEITQCLAAQGSAVREGDVLLMRTGWTAWYEQQSAGVREALAQPGGLAAPGLAPGERTAEVLWDLHIAAIGTDTPAVEVWPLGSHLEPDEVEAVRSDPRRSHEVFVHTLLLSMLGLPLGELWDLDALAADCAEDGRFDCLFVSAPLNLPAGVASPPNALAVK